MDTQRLPYSREVLHGTNDTHIRKRTRKHVLEEFVNKYFPLLPLDEILEVMKHKENRNRIAPIENSGLIKCRSLLVEWMVQVSEAFGFNNLTIHSSVVLLDRLLTKHEIARPRLQLIATCCILIAAKMDEAEEVIPPIEELNSCTDNTYTPELIIKMEAIVLNQLNWDISVVTAAHFLGVFLQAAVTENDSLLNGIEIINVESLKTDVVKSASFFVDMTRQEAAFTSYMPSVIASASVLLARKLLKVSPVWSDELIAITSYEVKQLSGCVDLIWSVYKNNFLGNTSGT